MGRRQVLEMVAVALLALVGGRADAGDVKVKAVSACCCGDTCCCGDSCKDACCCGSDCCGDTCCCDTAKGHKIAKAAKKSCCVKAAPAKVKAVR